MCMIRKNSITAGLTNLIVKWPATVFVDWPGKVFKNWPNAYYQAFAGRGRCGQWWGRNLERLYTAGVANVNNGRPNLAVNDFFVEVNEPNQLRIGFSAILKAKLVVPSPQRAHDPFSLAIGLRPIDAV